MEYQQRRLFYLWWCLSNERRSDAFRDAERENERLSVPVWQSGEKRKCTVLFPSRWQDFICGKDNAFLIGEAAGFISASSLEGISYALDSAEILRSVLLKQPEKINAAYWRATRKLRLKLFGKIVKADA